MWCMNRSVYKKIDNVIGGCNALNVRMKSWPTNQLHERGVNVVLNDM